MEGCSVLPESDVEMEVPLALGCSSWLSCISCSLSVSLIFSFSDRTNYSCALSVSLWLSFLLPSVYPLFLLLLSFSISVSLLSVQLSYLLPSISFTNAINLEPSNPNSFPILIKTRRELDALGFYSYGNSFKRRKCTFLFEVNCYYNIISILNNCVFWKNI